MAATKAQRVAKKTKPSKTAATKTTVAKAAVIKKNDAKKSPNKGNAKNAAATVAPKASVAKKVVKPVVAKKSAAKPVVAKKSAAKPVVAKKSAAKPVVAKKSAAKPVPKKSSLEKLELKTLRESGEQKAFGEVAEPKTLSKPKKVVAQLELADWASAPPKTDSTTPARDARQLLEQRKAIKNALAPSGDGKTIVDAYMRDVDHPFKAEMQAVRQIILGVSPKLSERIKWNAPSFYYKEDLGAFNPRSSEFCHLILLFPGGGALPEKSSILEGTHKDRREVKFHSMDEVKSKQPALEEIIESWIAYRDR